MQHIYCSLAGGSSKGRPSPPPTSQGGNNGPQSRYSLMFNNKPKPLGPYTPSWSQVLRAVQQCYMPIPRSSISTRANNSSAARPQNPAGPPGNLLEYYDMYLASDDEGGWERLKSAMQGSGQQHQGMPAGRTTSPQSGTGVSLPTNTHSSTCTSIEEPHGDPQDDELFCMRADLGPHGSKHHAHHSSDATHTATSGTDADSMPPAAPTPEQQAAQDLARLRRAVQLIRSPLEDDLPASRSPPRLSPRPTSPGTSPAACSLSVSSFDEAPFPTSYAWPAGARPFEPAGSPSPSSQADEPTPPRAYPSSRLSPRAPSLSPRAEPTTSSSPRHSTSGVGASPSPAAGQQQQQQRQQQGPGGEPGRQVGSQDGLEGDAAPAPGCVVLDAGLGVVQRHEDFGDPVELAEVLHQLRGAEVGAPAPVAPGPLERPALGSTVEDPEGPPAAGADLITLQNRV